MKFSNAISDFRVPFRQNFLLITLVVIFMTIWISTLVGTTDLANWLLENILVMILLTVLASTYKRLQFSDLSYLLIFVYLSLHVYGSQHTYAENPLGFWLQDVFDASRNHYDRIVKMAL